MQKVTVSIKKLKEISELCQGTDSAGFLRLQQERKVLAAVTEGIIQLYQVVDSGCGIGDVRKILGIEKPAKTKSPDDEADADPTENNTDSSEEQASEKGGEEESKSKGQCSSPDTDGQPTTGDSDNGKQQQPSGQSNPDPAPGTDGSSDPDKKPNQNHPGKAAASNYPDARTCIHNHSELKAGDLCPECGKGRLYLDRPRTRLLFEASSPVEPVIHIFNDLRCGLCKVVIKVPASTNAVKDGIETEDRYGFSAISLIAVTKYFGALPLYRNSNLHEFYGTSLPVSTQQDQCEKLADALQPLDQYMQQRAAMAEGYYADDATAVILEEKSKIIPDRKTGKPRLRDGGHSSVVLAQSSDGNLIARIKTGILHAGEWLDEILRDRPEALEKPQVMWDRHKCNSVTECEIIDTACNQHARGNLKDQQKELPDEIEPILKLYKKMFYLDSLTTDMSPKDRLLFHQKNSQSIMDEIIQRCQNAIDKKIFTENSELSKAFQYPITHKDELSGFLKHEGAAVSNNISERTIVYLVLLRKNVHHFKTKLGAKIADIILNVGLTASFSDANLFQYFWDILRNKDDVAKNPENWLPWKYLERHPNHKIERKARKRAWHEYNPQGPPPSA